MTRGRSRRLCAILDALPLESGMRVIEIGCGPAALAREIVRRISDGQVLAIDRSSKAISQAEALSREEIAAGRLRLRCESVETFALQPMEPPYDIAVAIRVGVLDGRHPKMEAEAKCRIAAALQPGGRLFVDGGDPLRVHDLSGRED